MLDIEACLGISYPEIYEMQVSAIFKAAHSIYLEDKTKVNPEIMIPLVMNSKEFKNEKNNSYDY